MPVRSPVWAVMVLVAVCASSQTPCHDCIGRVTLKDGEWEISDVPIKEGSPVRNGARIRNRFQGREPNRGKLVIIIEGEKEPREISCAKDPQLCKGPITLSPKGPIQLSRAKQLAYGVLNSFDLAKVLVIAASRSADSLNDGIVPWTNGSGDLTTLWTGTPDAGVYLAACAATSAADYNCPALSTNVQPLASAANGWRLTDLKPGTHWLVSYRRKDGVLHRADSVASLILAADTTRNQANQSAFERLRNTYTELWGQMQREATPTLTPAELRTFHRALLWALREQTQ